MNHATPLRIEPLRSRSAATFCARVPGSKSQTLRALTIAAMSEGRSTILGALRAADTDRLAAAFDAFDGVAVRASEDTFEIERDPVTPRAPRDWIDIGAGAAPARFLLAFSARTVGACRVTGSRRLCNRPMAGLFEALRAAGIRCDAHGRPGHLPAVAHGGEFATRRIAVAADESSQFASAMMLAFSADDAPAEIVLRGDAVSRPYLAMTARMLADAGVPWLEAIPGTWRRLPGAVRARTIQVEPDASSAGYFLALAAATGTTTSLTGIADDSTQADLALLDALAAMGCQVTREPSRIEVRGGPLRGIDVDLRDAPDAAPTIAAIATLASGPTTITGIAHLRDKESDRIATTCAEAARLGARATRGDDWMRIEPTGASVDAIVQCHDDHRIAMAFSVVGAARGGVAIADPSCVSKSFPGYWAEFERFLAHHHGRDGASSSREA